MQLIKNQANLFQIISPGVTNKFNIDFEIIKNFKFSKKRLLKVKMRLAIYIRIQLFDFSEKTLPLFKI